jgi:hypothetical protein
MSLYPKLFAAKTDCTSLDRPNVWMFPTLFTKFLK